MTKSLWAVPAAAMMCLSVQALQPGVIWFSSPVEPGEMVQVHGGDWGKTPSVEIGGVVVKPVRSSENGLCFEFPTNLSGGLIECRVAGDGGKSEPFVLNAPEVWWAHGDLGEDASPGGWLRLFGRSLDRKGGAQIVLTAKDGKRIELKLTKKDVWSLDSVLPANLAPGVYTIKISNGSGGTAGWRTVRELTVRPYREVWKSDVFAVTDFGAVANDGLDDTLGIEAALAAAGRNGGGTVLIPRGRFQFTRELVIPANTLLTGVSKYESQLYLPDTDEPPKALISGTHSFGVQDLFIHAGKYQQGIVCRTDDSRQSIEDKKMLSHDVTIRRVILKLIIDQYLLSDAEEYGRRASVRGDGIVVRNTRFVRIEDCDIFVSKWRMFFDVSGEYVRMANCRMNGSEWCKFGGFKTIFENNDVINCTFSIVPTTRNLFWSGNRQRDVFTNNREGMTHDCARAPFMGAVKGVCDGLKVRLLPQTEGQMKDVRYGRDFWVGFSLLLVDGKGCAQSRTITAWDGDTVTIDKPWTVQPDESSSFAVTIERARLIYADNVSEDTSIAIQLYGGATECVVARNKSYRSGGMLGFGKDYRGLIPVWFAQFIENEVCAGNGYRSPMNKYPSSDSVVEVFDGGFQGLVLTRSCELRRNVLHNNAYLAMSIENGLVENNLVKDADAGVRSYKYTSDVVLRGNRFDNVRVPLSVQVRNETVMPAGERFAAAVSGAETVLKKLPSGWEQAKATGRLESLLALLGQVDPATLESLLGITVKVKEKQSSVYGLLQNLKSISVPVVLEVTLAKDAPPVKCEIVAGEIPGWKIKGISGELVPGGTAELALEIASPEGAKAGFRLPLRCVFSGAGWRTTANYKPAISEDCEVTQWIVSEPFAQKDKVPAGIGWRIPEAKELSKIFANVDTGKTVVAAAILRVSEPVSVTFNFDRTPAAVFLNGARIGTDRSRGKWGSLVLEPGDNILKVVSRPLKKGEYGTFRMNYKTAETVKPGVLSILPATEVLDAKGKIR